MLLACYSQFFESNRTAFTRILKAMSVVSFRYNVICNLQTLDQERLYNEIAWKVSSKTLVNAFDVIKALREVYPEDEAFTLKSPSKIA